MEKAQAAVLLTQVIAGEVSAMRALEMWGSLDDEPSDLIAAAWHELSHLANDEDLVARDPEYLEHARARLRRYVERMKAE
jgi:hypothetical protein